MGARRDDVTRRDVRAAACVGRAAIMLKDFELSLTLTGHRGWSERFDGLNVASSRDAGDDGALN